MIEIIACKNVLVPTQNSNLGSISVRAVVFKKNNYYSAAIGIGEDNWIANNGILLSWDEANQYIPLSDQLEKLWK